MRPPLYRGMIECSDIAMLLDKRVHFDLGCRELGLSKFFP